MHSRRGDILYIMINSKGFTLIEVTVTVAIIAILSAGILFGVTEARQKSRDATRVADLRILQSAIELYKQKYDRYPARCANANPVAAGSWSGQAGTNYACVSGNQYIVGLAPEFLPVLPKDPKLNGSQSGYVYTTNTSGTVYKLMAKRTVESETVNYAHKLKSCDATDTGNIPCSLATQPPEYGNDPGKCDVGMCDRVVPSYSKPEWCSESDTGGRFQKTYAVWGGFANGTSDALSTQATEDIVCEIP